MAKKNKQSQSQATTPTDNTQDFPRAGFMRRLAAMIYDALVAIAVGMVAALAFLFILVILHSNAVVGANVEHFSDFMQTSVLFTTLLQVWVVMWVLGFFLWFWAKGGQTIGMRAWRMRIFSTVEAPMTFPRLLLRLVASLGGMGTLFVLFDYKHKLALQDRLAKTEILVLTKHANDHKSWR
ncbi:MAG: RDD family protein [Glaciecola sp.]|jgi:uncharacterized RDD family membrane protein YckC